MLPISGRSAAVLAPDRYYLVTGAEVPRNPLAPASAGSPMTTLTFPQVAPPVLPGVAFAEIHVAEPKACHAHNMHFACAAGYEEWLHSWDRDEVAQVHAAFQAAGVPYIVTTYERAFCDLGCDEATCFCHPRFPSDPSRS